MQHWKFSARPGLKEKWLNPSVQDFENGATDSLPNMAARCSPVRVRSLFTMSGLVTSLTYGRKEVEPVEWNFPCGRVNPYTCQLEISLSLVGPLPPTLTSE